MESGAPHLKAILDRLADDHRWTRARTLWLIEQAWPEIVGEAVSRHTRILALSEDGTLWVAVPSSVWSSELLFHKPRILESLRLRWPALRVTDLKTRVREETPLPALAEEPRDMPYIPFQRRDPDTHDLQALFYRVQKQYQAAMAAWRQRGYHPCAECRALTAPGYRLCANCEARHRQSSGRN
ncbi:MAG: DUF721 domain-containing protein [Firmicutes bacterium]|nr:DUF721 domain-containing protein [Bacillota bacterium]